MIVYNIKKIVHVTFHMQIGGSEQVIYNLTENTDPSRYDVSILCLEKPVGPFGIQLQKKGYQVGALDRQPGFDFSLIKKIRHYIRQHQVDVLHCHQYTPYFYGVLAAAFTKCKVIFTEHGRFYPDSRKLKRIILNPFLSLLTDHITAISSATKDALIRFENFPENKIQVVYNGIDDTNYLIMPDGRETLHSFEYLKKSLSIKENAYVLGTVARLDPVKNHKMMLRALKMIHQKYPETILIIVGDGPERKNLEEFVLELGLSAHVIFTGFREDAYLFYKIMDIFLLTSFTEGTAMTLLEAMATSLPCIATGVGGNPEIVRDGETGFIIPSDDENMLAEKIMLLFINKNMIKEMGKAGRKRFEENFTVKKMVESYCKMY